MEMEWFRSAGVGFYSSDGGSLLCDPWLNDGALLGSWFHWPPLLGDEADRVLNIKWDAVYITHLHGDHYDRRFMSKLAKAQPDTKVVIADFAHTWLRRSLESIGFQNRIIQAPAKSMQAVAPGISIDVIPADYCNPSLCGANISCVSPHAWGRAIDSLGLIEVDDFRILNANDATTVVTSMHLYTELPAIDLLMTAYTGASPFPQAFSNMSDQEKELAASKKAESFLEKVANVATLIKPRMVFPFAGQHMLSGDLVDLNQYRGMYSLPESARRLREMQDAPVFTLAPFVRVDPSSQLLNSDLYVEPSSDLRKTYLDQISHVTFPYQKRSLQRVKDGDHLLLLATAVEGLAWRYKALGHKRKKSLVIGSSLGYVTLNMDGNSVETSPGDSPNFEYTKVTADPRLLDSIIRRKPGYSGFTDAHMNVADGGNHLDWYREGEYDPGLTSLLFYL